MCEKWVTLSRKNAIPFFFSFCSLLVVSEIVSPACEPPTFRGDFHFRPDTQTPLHFILRNTKERRRKKKRTAIHKDCSRAPEAKKKKFHACVHPGGHYHFCSLFPLNKNLTQLRYFWEQEILFSFF